MMQHRHELTVSSSEKVGVVFSFDAPMLDPILVSNHFVPTILEFSIFGQEPTWKALERSAKPDVLFHTSIYTGIEGKIYKICAAPLRRRPNGEDIRCCNAEPKYMRCSRDRSRLYFRCGEDAHIGARTFAMEALPEKENVRWIWGRGGRNRVIVKLLEQDDHGK